MIDNDDRPAPSSTSGTSEERIVATVRLLARLLGHLMAREAFAQLTAGNDNRRPETATE